MAIRILTVTKDPNPSADPISAHVNIRDFQWVNEQTQNKGSSTREVMYDWIVNKKGSAYVKSLEGDLIYLFGAISPNGDRYVRGILNGVWNDILLRL